MFCENKKKSKIGINIDNSHFQSMSRRKQARPRFVKHGEVNADEGDVLASGNMDNGISKNLNNKINKNGALDSDKSLTEANLFEENNETDEYYDEVDDDNDVSRVGDSTGALDNSNKIKVDDLNPNDLHNPNDDGINYDDDDANDVDEATMDDDLLGSPYSENDNSLDSFCSDLFSSHTSSSFSPSLSDGIATPNSLIHDNEASVIATNGTVSAEKTATTQLVNSGHRGHHRRIKNNNNNNNIDVGKTTTDKDGKGDGNYNCPFCEKTFPRLGYLKKHEQSHAEHMPFKCEFCARLFKHKRSRDRHTKLHTGDRRYRCPHCEAAFSRSDHLKIHMKTHDNQKPFQCTVCNRGYNTAAALTSHMQNHKKQAALLGSPSLNNYSPRSTGSTGSSTASSTQKRKYSSIPLHLQQQQQQQQQNNRLTTITGNHPLDYTNSFMKKYATAGRINCLYCTKTDFVSMEKLHQHMEAMHGGLIRNEQSPNTGNTPNLQLSCEFCTMKFSSVQVMFHHLKSTHLDRMSANSPNGFLTYFGRHLGSSIDDGSCHSLFKSPTIEDNKKLEFPCDDKRIIVPESDTTPDILKSPIIPNIKQESMECDLPQEQDVPTDLSQPKSKRMCTDSPVGREKEQQIDKISPLPPMKLSPPAPAEPPAFLCNQCNAALPDFDGFRAHLKSHLEQGSINNTFLCQHCGITFTEQTTYESHVASHFLISSVEYSCTNTCNKAFQKPDDLQKHLFENHSQILYKCNICSELFETKVAVQVHFAVGHSNEIKIYRCSACMEVYRTDTDFRHHIRTRHTTSGAVQCIFCRTICSSELEMHFHLAAHARQFRCPACPESFHVEFLLDRHMQTHYSSQQYHNKNVNNNNNNSTINNNNILDYQQAANEKNLLYNFSGTSNLADKLFNPLQLDSIKHHQQQHQQQMTRNLYDVANLGKRISTTTPISGSSTLGGLLLDNNKNYQNSNKNLIGLYNPVESMSVAQKLHNLDPNYGRFHNTVHDAVIKSHLFDTLPSNLAAYHEALKVPTSISNSLNSLKTLSTTNSASNNITSGTGNSGRYCIPEKGYSCGICERNDFSTESEVHNHRKVVHNIKTGVSLRCAYCNGDFRSRSELENHMKLSHNTSGKHKCLICDEIFPSPAVLAEHKLSHCKVGASGKCSNCMTLLPDVLTFKGHLSEHNDQELPVQCICCRQTLNSEFEISLHAKFHTKTSETSVNTCALCLEPLPSTNDTKICENCYKKRNFSHPAISSITGGAQQQMQQLQPEHLKRELTATSEVRCNLCKKNFPTAIKLQEHLIEHTFVGCEDRGYICFICSSVFTAPGGLQNHIIEHGLTSRPYDCNLCTAKFFFRAELDHHMVEHESVSICKEDERISAKASAICEQENAEIMQTRKMKMETNSNENNIGNDETQSHHSDHEEDEHIEVEKLPKDEKLETNLNNLSENNPTKTLTNGNVGNSE